MVLTLHSLLSHSDGIVPIYNDEVLAVSLKIMQENSKLHKNSRPSFKDMNTLIAQSVLSVFFPAANTPQSKLSLWSPSANSLSNVLSTLCPNPAYKFLQLRSIPQCDKRTRDYNADLWNELLQRMRQMVVSNSSEHLVNWTPQTLVKSLGNLLVLRGDKVYDERPTLETDVFKCQVTGVRDSHRLFGNQKSVGLLSNN